MNDQGEIVGMVDVLKLTYATLEQINTMQTGESDSGPAWNKFWMSLEHESESMISGEGSHHHTTGGRSLMSPDMSRGHERQVDASVAPNDSASHVGMDSPPPSHLSRHMDMPPEDVPFAFKFKAPSGRVHRVQVTASHGLAELISAVVGKLGAEIDAVGGVAVVEDGKLGSSGFALSYLDDEGDSVSITTDEDLLQAILLAKNGRRDKVDLFVHDPRKPPMAATLDPQPLVVQVATPPASATVRRRRTADDEEEDESDEEPRVKSKSRKAAPPQPAGEVIQGVPNELLLPGAIVTLAVVIVGVFALTRATSR